MKLKHLTPMLNVSNIETSLKFYQKALNFEIVSPKDTVKQWRWATIRSGDTQLMLSESCSNLGLNKNIDDQEDSNWPTIFYFYPDDVEQLYQHVNKQGFQTTELETTFYGMREFSMRDPDGHLLSFGVDAGA